MSAIAGVEAQEVRALLAVAVPVYRSRLTADERLSLQSVRHHLGDYPFCVVAPEGLSLPPELGSPGVVVERFAKAFFRGREGYNRLLLSRRFFQAFARYEFVLVAQLDTLVFSSDVEAWCARPWDYVGAPWGESFSEEPMRFDAVGNGGLSLRRVGAAMRVLATRVPAKLDYSMGPPPKLWECRQVRAALQFLNHLRQFLPAVTLESWLRRSYFGHEDVFWGLWASKFDPNFRVPDAEEAMRFAFETSPVRCFEKTGAKLPFGCHGWNRYDRPFWESYIHKALPPGAVRPYRKRANPGLRTTTESAPERPAPHFSICTLVTDWSDYEGFRKSAEENGFDSGIAEFLTIDNSTRQQMDAFAGIRWFLEEATADQVLVVHQDVRILRPVSELMARMQSLSASDPRWAVLGNAGKGSNFLSGPIAVQDPLCLHHHGPFPQQVESLDENFLLIKRSSGVRPTQGLEGFHFYGLDLCQAAKRIGRRCYVIDYLVFHRSHGNIDEVFFAAQDRLEEVYSECFPPGEVATTCSFVSWGVSRWKKSAGRAKSHYILARAIPQGRGRQLAWERGVECSRSFFFHAGVLEFRLRFSARRIWKHMVWWSKNFSIQRFRAAVVHHFGGDRSVNRS